MISLNNLANNPNMTAIANKGVFTVFEHQKDMSVSPAYASVAYFMHEMNVRKRQVLCNLNNSAVRIQAGAACKVFSTSCRALFVLPFLCGLPLTNNTFITHAPSSKSLPLFCRISVCLSSARRLHEILRFFRIVS